MIDQANAGLCNSCGKCLRKCPQHLNIPKNLIRLKKNLKDISLDLKCFL